MNLLARLTLLGCIAISLAGCNGLFVLRGSVDLPLEMSELKLTAKPTPDSSPFNLSKQENYGSGRSAEYAIAGPNRNANVDLTLNYRFRWTDTAAPDTKNIVLRFRRTYEATTDATARATWVPASGDPLTAETNANSGNTVSRSSGEITFPATLKQENDGWSASGQVNLGQMRLSTGDLKNSQARVKVQLDFLRVSEK